MQKNNSLLNSLPFQGKEATRKYGFTLVELIVVITILAILGTIAFISLQGYSASSRDSVRISDVSNMKTSLELFHLNAGKYPLPDNEGIVSYNSQTLWYQGTFGSTVVSQLSRNINEIPTDSLTDKEYIYSVANNKNEFEILNLLEGDIAYNTLTPLSGEIVVNSQTNAANTTRIPRIDGQYNGVFIKTATDIVPTPSIITSENLPMVLNGENIKSQIITGGENIPNIGSVNTATGKLDITLSVYNGTINKDSTPEDKVLAMQAIQGAYTDSVLANSDIYAHILSKTSTGDLVALVDTVILKNNTAVTTTTQQDIITQTCTDLIQNQDETGVDCGGTCGACPITCPTGYILVPGSYTFSTSDFCVAKYEMKIQGNDNGETTYNSSMVPESRASGTPWVSINQPQAITECNNLGTGYHLITNNEWMTIARNIEANSGNWANGTLGSLVSAGGGLYRGNVNLNDSASCGISTVLDGNTPGTNCEVNGRNKRMHVLSNGSEIWDISGNLWEHVNGSNNVYSTNGEVSDGNACSVIHWYSWNSLNDGSASCTFTNTTPTYYSKANHGPIGDYNANYGVGRIFSLTSTNRTFIRGGTNHSLTNAGAYALSVEYGSSFANIYVGFRCAFSVN